MINKPFRAKKKQFDGKGEWVYGWLVELSKDSFSDEKRYGICDKAIRVGTLSGEDVVYNLKITEVVPHTICEATGLCTHDIVEIWENDICEDVEGRKYVVRKEYDVPGGCWAESGFVLDEIGVSGYTHFTDMIDNWENEIQVNVVGNIFDNPEIREAQK